MPGGDSLIRRERYESDSYYFFGLNPIDVRLGSYRAILGCSTSDSGQAVLLALRHLAKRVEFRFGRHLRESPKRCIREIETHEVCPGRETAPGFFMSAIRRPERLWMHGQERTG